jgi:glutamyl-tRNA synthetase
MDVASTREVLESSIPVLQALDSFAHDAQYTAMKEFAQSSEFKNGQIFGTLRAAVTGQKVSPPTFETMEILGKDESLRRLQLVLDSLSS